MTPLDPRSLMLVIGLLSFLCALLTLAMYRSFPPSIGGLREWARGSVCCLAAAPLFALRDQIPDFLSIVVANAAFAAGVLFCLDALCRFTRRPPPHRLLTTVWIVWVALIAWFALVMPNYPVRQVVICTGLAGSFAGCALVIRRSPEQSFPYRFCQFGFALAAVSVAVRPLLVLSGHGDLYGVGFNDRTPMQNLFLVSLAGADMVFSLGFVLMAQDRLVQLLRHEAAHDLLSGALSRAAVLDLLNREVIRAHRHQRELSLLLLDLDHFKLVNDRYGHLTGDRVIAEFGDVVRAQLRDQDFFGRYGGEEFLVILPETDLDGAAMVAERIRCATGRSSDLPRYSVSIGVCALRPGQDALALLGATDVALYQAKAKGRDRVELSPDVPASPLLA